MRAKVSRIYKDCPECWGTGFYKGIGRPCFTCADRPEPYENVLDQIRQHFLDQSNEN